MGKMCKSTSMMYILIMNLIALCICLVAMSLLIWAYCTYDVSYYVTLAGGNASLVRNVFIGAMVFLGLIILLCICGIAASIVVKKRFICCYAFFVIVFLIIMLLFTLTWCGALGYLIDRHLEEELVKLQKHYKSEFSKNIASIVMNVLQIVFSACGVYGPADYQAAEKAPMWPAVRNDPQRVALLGAENFVFPLTCCPILGTVKKLIKDKGLTAQGFYEEINMIREDVKTCAVEYHKEGLNPKIRRIMIIVLIISAVSFFVIITIMILLVVAACHIYKKGPKSSPELDKLLGKIKRSDKDENDSEQSTEESKKRPSRSSRKTGRSAGSARSRSR